MANPEQLPSSGERGLEALGNAAAERQAELDRSSPEKSVEQSPERQAEAAAEALRSAHEQSISVERPANEQAHDAPSAPVIRRTNSSRARNKAYKEIMTDTQAKMKPGERAFSKTIHQPVVEKTSEVVGATVARPNAILFGALFAIILSGGVYVVAKYYGYTLSGFEAIGAFIVGWAFGMLVDFVRLALRK